MPSFYHKLRKGQKDLVNKYQPSVSVLSAQLPGGYGKTFCAYALYATAKMHNKVDRLLMIVANLTQVDQILRESKLDLKTLEIDVKQDAKKRSVYHYRNDGKSVLFSISGTFEIFVTTIQSLHSGVENEVIFNLLRTGNWMIFIDEMHHLANGFSWGEAVKAIRKSKEIPFSLAVSATPMREDLQNVFGKEGVDVTVSYMDALKEGLVLKSLNIVPLDFNIKSFQRLAGDVEYRASELGNEESGLFTKKLETEEQRKLRGLWDFINPLLNKAFLDLVITSSKLGIRVKLLVRVHRQWMAKEISNIVQGRYDLTCDWVGCDLRDDETNRKVIQRFLMNDDDLTSGEKQLNVLVQVGMAGEGFNCKRIVSILDLTNPRSRFGISTKQFVLRGSRWIDGVSEELQICKIYVPADHFLAKIKDPIAWLDACVTEDYLEDVDDSEYENLRSEVLNKLEEVGAPLEVVLKSFGYSSAEQLTPHDVEHLEAIYSQIKSGAREVGDILREDKYTRKPNEEGDNNISDIDPYGPYFAEPVTIDEDTVWNTVRDLWKNEKEIPDDFVEVVRESIYKIKKKERDQYNRRAQDDNASSLAQEFVRKCVSKRRFSLGRPRVGEGYSEEARLANKSLNKIIRGSYPMVDHPKRKFEKARSDYFLYATKNILPTWIQ